MNTRGREVDSVTCASWTAERVDVIMDTTPPGSRRRPSLNPRMAVVFAFVSLRVPGDSAAKGGDEAKGPLSLTALEVVVKVYGASLRTR